MKRNLLNRVGKKEKKRGHPLSAALLVFFLCGLSAPAPAAAQAQQRITLEMKQATVEQVVVGIRETTRYKFVYRVEDLPAARRDYNFRNATIGQVMDELLSGTRLKWTDDEGTIIISRIAAQGQAAADAVITGRITDGSGKPVAGATIMVKNTFVGVTTDANGRFSIKLPKVQDPVLVVSFLGMKKQEIVVREGQSDYQAVLVSDVANIDAVVVTGYGDKAKSSFTGAATIINKEQLLSAGTKNVFQSLAAFVPGMQIVDNIDMGSDPNTLPDILIRGRSSFTAGSTIPTFVVDGAEVELEYIFDMDMNDIENVTVLKDATATAVYGSKAANGVVVITTRPMTGGRMKLNYSGTFRLVVPDLGGYDLLNAEQKLEYEKLAQLYTSPYGNGRHQYALNEAYNERYQRVRSGVDTDWLSKPVRNALATNHNLTIYGGEGAVRYHVSARYGDDRGAMKNSDRVRYALSYKINYNLGKKLFFQNQTSINSINKKDVPYGSFSDYAGQNPYDKPYNDDGSYNVNLSYGKKNPVYEASLGSYSRGETFSLNNIFDIKYQILSDLRLEGSFALTKYKNDTEKFLSPHSQEFDNVTNEAEKGSITVTNTKQMDYYGKLFASYNLSFGNGTLLSFVGGGNISQEKTDMNGYKGIGFHSDKLRHPAYAVSYPAGSPSGSQNISRAIGFFLNGNYIYQDRYFVDASYRREGSSKFGSDNRFGNFWAVGAGWNVHNEGFLNMNPTDRLKLRASVGHVGNASFSPYQAMTIYEYRADLFYGKGIGSVPVAIGNPDLQYEKALKFNVGLDLNLFGQRWDMTFDFYRETTDNLLLDNTKAPSVGVLSATENVGKIRNTGVEFRTRVNTLRTQDWDWALSLTLTHNKNKIIKISNALKKQNELNNADADEDDLRKPIPFYVEGESTSAVKVVRSGGIDPLTGNEIYITRDGRRTFVYDFRDKVIAGDAVPKAFGVISSFLRWKDLELNMMFRYSLGATLYNETLVTRVEGADPKSNADSRVFNDRWKHPGDYAKYRNIAITERPNQTDRFVQDEYVFSMQTLSLAYVLPQRITEKLRISRLRVEFLANDLFRLSTVRQERGLDYPFARTYELSVNINF